MVNVMIQLEPWEMESYFYRRMESKCYSENIWKIKKSDKDYIYRIKLP